MFLEGEEAAHPELFVRPVSAEDDATLREIGIDPAVFRARMPGHIKLLPGDFVVEEISRDGIVHTVDIAPLFGGAPPPRARTLWCDMVKMDTDTLRATADLARRLGIEKNSIGVAGIKDKRAITSQAISIRGVAPDAVASVSAPNFFLKNGSAGTGALSTGALRGNRFTLLIRTPDPVAPAQWDAALGDIADQGFWNFFYLQRFGTPRLISHRLGELILRGDYEGVVRMSLTHASSREIAYFRHARARLDGAWGDPERIMRMIEPLPDTFRHERLMMEYLHDRPGDFAGALNRVPDQVKIWIYAWASWLFNRALSAMAVQEDGEAPSVLPVPLNPGPDMERYYGHLLDERRMRPPFRAFRDFPYARPHINEVETLKQFTLHGSRCIPEGIVMAFDLDKGAYATSLLAHIFALSAGASGPYVVKTDEVDTKEIMGTGSLSPVREKFRAMAVAPAYRNGTPDDAGE
jgi:TruD family tRNA pseudouridine synthase